jgi:hypothetical protein
MRRDIASRRSSDGTLREHHHRIAHADAAGFGAAQSGRRDVGAEHDLLVAEVRGDLREIRLRRRDA